MYSTIYSTTARGIQASYETLTQIGNLARYAVCNRGFEHVYERLRMCLVEDSTTARGIQASYETLTQNNQQKVNDALSGHE